MKPHNQPEHLIIINRMANILIDLFDHSGNAAEPYRAAGWHIIQVDIKHGIDILTWNYKAAIHIAHAKAVQQHLYQWGKYSTSDFKFGLLAAIPCTDYAISGAKHFKRKDADGSTAKSQLLVNKSKEIIDWLDSNFELMFWKVENPRTRIHTLNPWLGNITQKFNPCDFAGYMPITDG